MNVTAADGIRPFAASRRATGTEPHSHTGNAMPATPAAGSCKGFGRRVSRSNALDGTKTSIAAEASAPIRTKGTASINSEEKTRRKFCAQPMFCGARTRSATAPTTTMAAIDAAVRQVASERTGRPKPPSSSGAGPISISGDPPAVTSSAVSSERDGEAREGVREQGPASGCVEAEQRRHDGLRGDVLVGEDLLVEEQPARHGGLHDGLRPLHALLHRRDHRARVLAR